MALNPPVNPKSNNNNNNNNDNNNNNNKFSFSFFSLSAKVRRLYDIANILSSLGLIKKKVFVGPHHIKKPGYAWSGPSLADIEAICKSLHALLVIFVL